jgi:hypothetical protein
LTFAKMAQDRADGVIRGTGTMLFNERARVGASSLKHRLPVMTYVAEEVPYGHLMSYGLDLPDFSAAQRPTRTKYSKAQNLLTFLWSNQQSLSWS